MGRFEGSRVNAEVGTKIDDALKQPIFFIAFYRVPGESPDRVHVLANGKITGGDLLTVHEAFDTFALEWKAQVIERENFDNNRRIV